MMMRIYWRSTRTRRCVARLAVATALAVPIPVLASSDELHADRVTAREAIERQFASAPSAPRSIDGAEAARISEKYHDRIGKMLEPKREIGVGGNPR